MSSPALDDPGSPSSDSTRFSLSREVKVRHLFLPLLFRLIAGTPMTHGLGERAAIFPLTARVCTITPFKDSSMLRYRGE